MAIEFYLTPAHPLAARRKERIPVYHERRASSAATVHGVFVVRAGFDLSNNRLQVGTGP